MRFDFFSVIGFTLLLSGCVPISPSINISGAYLPDWLFCIAAGGISTGIVYHLVHKYKRSEWLSPQVIIYPFITALFSMCYWIVFFN